MIIPDANLLLFAYDSLSPYHKSARLWWESCLSGREAVGLVYPVLFAFLRIATSRRVYAHPMSVKEACGHLNIWKNRKITRILEPGEDYLDDVERMLTAAGSAGGNLVTDAQIAALALSHKGVVHTADYDFKRFPGLKVVFPLEKKPVL